MNKIFFSGIAIIIIIAFLIVGMTWAYQYWWMPEQETPPETTEETGDKTKETAKITLLSPNGGEQWQIGGTYEIKWTKGEKPDDAVTIFLDNDKIWSNPLVIASNASNTGNYSWTAPQSLADASGAAVTIYNDSNYRILVQGTNSGDSDLSDATFSIAETPVPGCSMKWWFDSSTTVCNYSQFCGTYMYYGLQTFDTEAECQAHLP